MNRSRQSESPDGRHKAVLNEVGEIRFGPAYFDLCIDGMPLPDRIFGDIAFWSDDGRFLTVQEWYTTDYNKGPITSLVILDLEKMVQSQFERIHGFANPTSVVGHTLNHEETRWHKTGGSTKIAMQTEIDLLEDWEPITQQTASRYSGPAARPPSP